MRLINTTTLHLSEFMGSQVPRYAILTHTWEEEEVSYQDWLAWQATGDAAVGGRKGFRKIEGACRQARKNHLDWLWADTNCIDKTSSAELSEAINSMYAWYRDARICYGYLADVSDTGTGPADSLREFSESRWFTRGWTLQELLAPRLLVFYSKTWTKIGHRSGMLAGTIARVTGIGIWFLIGEKDVNEASDGMKMSWLSHRETTRVEDMAYCMLGLFDINMPLLYGEGTKAFTRLQEEIIRSHQDHTLFCWEFNPDEVPMNWASMLAPSPRVFGGSWRYTVQTHDTNLLPYSVTNIGLSISLPVFYTIQGVVAVLDAADSEHNTGRRSCLFLQRPFHRARHFRRMAVPAVPVDIWPAQLTQARVTLHVQSGRLPTRDAEERPRRWYDNDDIDRLGGLMGGRGVYEEGTRIVRQPPRRPPPPQGSSPFAVFLFIEPSADEFFLMDEVPNNSWSNGPSTQTLLSMRALRVGSVPNSAYDGIFDVLRLRLWQSTDVPTSASMFELQTPGILDTWYLLFAVHATETGPIWFCDIATERHLAAKGIAWDPNTDKTEDIFARWMKLVAANWREQTTAEAVDGLHLTLGGRLRTWTDYEFRPAILSANRDLPFIAATTDSNQMRNV